MSTPNYLLREYPVQQGALEIAYIEEFFSEFPERKTATEIIQRLEGRECQILMAEASLPEDGSTVVPVSYKVSHELCAEESDPKLADLVDRLRETIDFDEQKVLYNWLGATRLDWRGQGHFRALTEEQEVWAVAEGYDTIVVKTKNRNYDMRGTLDSLQFNVIKLEPSLESARLQGVHEQAAGALRARCAPEPAAGDEDVSRGPAQSRRLAAVQTPVIPVVAAWTAETPGTISLGQGIVSYGPPPEAIEASHHFGGAPADHRYGPIEGLPELVSAIEAKLQDENGITVRPESRVVVTAGANLAFMNALLAIADVGDDVILLAPYYFNHEMAIAMAGAVTIRVPTTATFQIDEAAIASAITPRTRAVVTVSPNNPTGAVYSEASLRAVNALCRERGVFHIHDETYEYFTYGSVAHFSPGGIPEAAGHTISLYSLSKAYGLASWRVGYMVIPEPLSDAVNKVQDTLLICAPAVSQRAAIAALSVGRPYAASRLAGLDRTRHTVHAALSAAGMPCVAPLSEGAFYFFPRVHTPLSAMALTERLIREHRVAVIPGSAFGDADLGLQRGERRRIQRAAIDGGHHDRADAHFGEAARRRRHVGVGNAGVREHGLRDVAGRAELRLADRIELQRAVRRIGDHADRRALRRLDQRRVRGARHLLEAGEDGKRDQDHARQHHGLAPDAVRQPAEEQVERRRGGHQPDHQRVHRVGRHLDDAFDEELAVEERRVPDRALRHHHRAERDQHHAQTAPLAEGLAERRLRAASGLAQLLEHRALVQLHADPDRERQQHDRHQERHAPAPVLEGRLAEQPARAQRDHQRAAQAERRGRAHPAGEVAAAVGGRVLGDVDRRPAPFAAERQALQDPQQHEQHRRDHAGVGVGRQQADPEGGAAHDGDRDEEGALAADQVAHATEDQCAERPEREAGGERAEREDVARGVVQSREEGAREDAREWHEDEEVVPLEGGARRGSGDHEAQLARTLGGVRHGAGIPETWTGPKTTMFGSPREDRPRCRVDSPSTSWSR